MLTSRQQDCIKASVLFESDLVSPPCLYTSPASLPCHQESLSLLWSSTVTRWTKQAWTNTCRSWLRGSRLWTSALSSSGSALNYCLYAIFLFAENRSLDIPCGADSIFPANLLPVRSTKPVNLKVSKRAHTMNYGLCSISNQSSLWSSRSTLFIMTGSFQ
jgi:hypothetical protein